ncbi:dTDP-4-dehydrorhamnose reductase [Alphaproteobacteria bacterium]|nr:dTDP-4-dehydrorhamnose reductase [Alphaproteobacteria bacterium]
MKILLTGAGGQVGSALAQLGQLHGFDLVALLRTELDVSNALSIAEAFEKYKPDFVINAAAYTAVDKAEDEPDQAYLINEVAAALLSNACAKATIPLLHISTDYVFDGLRSSPYSESDTVNPMTVYGKSKEAGERAVRSRLPHHIILRTSWVFSGTGTNFVKTILNIAKDRKELNVVADQFGGPSSAQSIARAIFRIVSYYEMNIDAPWGTYHFSQTPFVSWYDFAKIIIKKATVKGLLEHPVKVFPIASSAYPTQVDRPKNSQLSCDLIESYFPGMASSWKRDLDETLNLIMRG